MTSLWTSSETIGPPSELIIDYKTTNTAGQVEQKSQSATSTTYGTSVSSYEALTYYDRDGKRQTSEVLARKTDKTRTTIAAVNPGYVAWRLSKKLGLPFGDALSENITISQYIITVDGPALAVEITEQYVSMAQFSGGLQLEEWGSFQPSGSEQVLSHRTIRRMNYAKTSDGRDVTRTRTERYIAAAESSEWKNYAAKRGKDIKALVSGFPQVIEPFVRSLTPLVYEGTEVQVETGRLPVPVKPSDQDIARDQVTNGGGSSDVDPWPAYNVDSDADGVPDWAPYVPGAWQDFNQDSNSDGVPDWAPYVPNDSNYSTTSTEVSNEKIITGTVIFDGTSYDDGNPTVTATYDMPFAPDDYFAYVNGVRRLMRGGATDAAIAFGKAESALDIGHAYGQNIVTGWNESPSLDLSPVYLQLAGIEGAFLMDSVSYAWGPEGMVVSSDLMLLGVSGWYGASQPATSWLRVPVSVSGLREVTAGIAGTANKANSIVLPSGFSARNPGPTLAALPSNGSDSYALYRSSQGLVGPTLTLERESVASGPLLLAVEYPYALVLAAETAVMATGPAITLQEFTAVSPPAAAVSVAGLAPVVVSGASVAVPAGVVAVAALAPEVASGAAVVVPAAEVSLEGVAPDQVGRERTQTLIPAGVVALAALAPEVVAGAAVEVPAAVVAAAGVAPQFVGKLPIEAFALFQLYEDDLLSLNP